MKNNSTLSPTSTAIFSGGIVLLLVVAFQTFAFTEPTQPPPLGNVSIPLNTSSVIQEKLGPLIVNSGGGEPGLIVDQGRVGFGTIAPGAAFEVYSPEAANTAIRISNGLTTPGKWELRSNQTPLNNGFSIAEVTEGSVGVRFSITSNPDGNYVGIDTDNPQSKLQIVGGYLQIDTSTGKPPDSDCNNSSERGRMIVDRVGAVLWVCVDSGWVAR